MSQPYLYKRKVDLIIYHIQTNEQIHLSDKSRHDIHSNMYQAVTEEIANAMKWNENWYEAYLELKKRDFPKKYNEIRIWVAKQDEPIDPEEMLQRMFELDEGKSIR
jgi:hypothetical protein